MLNYFNVCSAEIYTGGKEGEMRLRQANYLRRRRRRAKSFLERRTEKATRQEPPKLKKKESLRLKIRRITRKILRLPPPEST
ncbi:MAG: hypothetical protein AAB536_01750 [Patescibacteria group bacterium]